MGEPKWRNFFENTATVQFDHRCLAYASTGLVAGTFLLASRNGIWTVLPAFTRTMTGALGMVGVQVALGISTLLLYVPIELAAAHQAGSLVLLTLATSAVHSLKFVPFTLPVAPMVAAAGTVVVGGATAAGLAASQSQVSHSTSERKLEK